MAAVIPHSQPDLGEAEASAAAAVVRSGFVGSGQGVRQFERAIGAFVGRTHGIATSSGSTALHLSLLAAGAVHGDEVIIPAFVCRAVLNSVLHAGATPVLADVDPKDLTMSVSDLQNRITSKTRAIVAVHMFGAPADMDGICAVAKNLSRVTVIEDAASSLGARIGGKPAGSHGQVSILSFASTKMITTGAGGMVLSDDPEFAGRVRKLLEYDSDSTTAGSSGFNFQMTDVQAAIGMAQLSRLPQFLSRRTAIAGAYSSALSAKNVRAIEARKNASSSHYRFLFDAGQRARPIVSRLQSKGVDARNGVAHFLYDYTGQAAAEFSGAESVRNQLVSLPIYPALKDDEVARVAALAGEAIEL